MSLSIELRHGTWFPLRRGLMPGQCLYCFFFSCCCIVRVCASGCVCVEICEKCIINIMFFCVLKFCLPGSSTLVWKGGTCVRACVRGRYVSMCASVLIVWESECLHMCVCACVCLNTGICHPYSLVYNHCQMLPAYMFSCCAVEHVSLVQAIKDLWVKSCKSITARCVTPSWCDGKVNRSKQSWFFGFDFVKLIEFYFLRQINEVGVSGLDFLLSITKLIYMKMFIYACSNTEVHMFIHTHLPFMPLPCTERI